MMSSYISGKQVHMQLSAGQPCLALVASRSTDLHFPYSMFPQTCCALPCPAGILNPAACPPHLDVHQVVNAHMTQLPEIWYELLPHCLKELPNL